MSGIAEAVSILLSLTQVASQALVASKDLGEMIAKAQAEGRDLTDAELDTARNAVLLSRSKLE